MSDFVSIVDVKVSMIMERTGLDKTESMALLEQYDGQVMKVLQHVLLHPKPRESLNETKYRMIRNKVSIPPDVLEKHTKRMSQDPDPNPDLDPIPVIPST